VNEILLDSSRFGILEAAASGALLLLLFLLVRGRCRGTLFKSGVESRCTSAFEKLDLGSFRRAGRGAAGASVSGGGGGMVCLGEFVMVDDCIVFRRAGRGAAGASASGGGGGMVCLGESVMVVDCIVCVILRVVLALCVAKGL
jgi:hypothetical protein